MPETLPTEGLPPRDRRRVEQVNRNIRIRQAYPELRDEHGHVKAVRVLADQHHVSPSLVRKVLNCER